MAQIAVTDWRNKTSVTTEDTLGRVATKSWPPINPGETATLETYRYTVGGQVAQVLTTTNGATNRLASYTYDDLNRLAKKTPPEGVLAYTWTPDSHG